MGGEPAQRESFIVRVWWKPGQDAPEIWVHHVRSGESVVLRDLEAVKAYIERRAPKAAAHERAGLR
jgi:hypothetical protein